MTTPRASVLPQGWTRRRLRFDCLSNPVKSKLDLPDDTEVSFVPMDAVGELGGLRLDQTRELADVYNGYTYFADGDVCIAKITPCFENGKGAIAEELVNGVAFGTTELHVLRPSATLDTRFLFYLTIAHDFRSHGEAEMLGAGGQKRVPEEFLKDWTPSLPRIEVQQRIVRFLDDKTARIDALIEKKQALLERLAEKRQALITRAVTKGLHPDVPMKPSGDERVGDIPAHWKLLPLKRLVEDGAGLQMGPFGGMLTDLPDDATGFKLYGQENTISGNFELGNRWIEEDRFLELKRYQLCSGDLVITRKGSLGSCRMFPEDSLPGIADSDTIRIRPRRGMLSPGWAIALLHDAQFVADQIASERRGAILSGLNTTVVGSILFTVPPEKEQLDIVRKIEDEVRPIDNVVALIDSAMVKLREHRLVLITAAVTGQLPELNG